MVLPVFLAANMSKETILIYSYQIWRPICFLRSNLHRDRSARKETQIM